MVEKIYSNAFNEVLTILAYIPAEEYNKIPEEVIQVFEENSNDEYEFEYNPKLTLTEQNISYEAKLIIAILFRDYWATDIQKEKILLKEKYNLQQIEEEKREKYNIDNIFKQKTRVVEENKDEVGMIEYKQPLFIKILNKIKSIFIK